MSVDPGNLIGIYYTPMTDLLLNISVELNRYIPLQKKIPQFSVQNRLYYEESISSQYNLKEIKMRKNGIDLIKTTVNVKKSIREKFEAACIATGLEASETVCKTNDVLYKS